jgi:hypothetical protein
MHNGNDEDYCVASPIHHAKGKAFQKSAAGAFGRWRPTTWIGDRVIYRDFDSMFKLDAQSITYVRIIRNFL